MKKLLLVVALAILFVAGCSNDERTVSNPQTYPTGITVLSPQEGDTVLLPADPCPQTCAFMARVDMSAHVTANVPGGAVVVFTYYAHEYPPQHWCGGWPNYPSFYPQSDDFCPPFVSDGDALYDDTTDFVFYFHVIAGDSSVWRSRSTHIVVVADTSH